jgi:hypothetical protein
MSIEVKRYNFLMTGAPVLSGLDGAGIALLDACLVNGFNPQTISTITVTDEVATVTTVGNHGYEVDQVVLISGTMSPEFHDEFYVKAVPTSDSFTFDIPGGALDSTGGSVKVAPLGWEKVYSGTNKAVYRSSNMVSTRISLMVHETISRNMSVQMVEDPQSVDYGIGMGDLIYWFRSNLTTSASRQWALIGDDRLFFFMPKPYDTSYNFFFYTFGDYIGFRVNDPYGCYIGGHSSHTPSHPEHSTSMLSAAASTGMRIARDHTHINQKNVGWQWITIDGHSLYQSFVSMASGGMNRYTRTNMYVPVWMTDAQDHFLGKAPFLKSVETQIWTINRSLGQLMTFPGGSHPYAQLCIGYTNVAEGTSGESAYGYLLFPYKTSWRTGA